MDIKQAVNEYSELTTQEKLLKSRKTELAKFIKKHATENGVQDDKGSYYIDNDDFTYGSQARKKVSLNFDRAKNFFIEKGIWKDVVKYEEKIDEDKISELVANEDMTMEELEEITDIKVTYAIDVRAKEKAEDMPEVEVVETSHKPKLRILKKLGSE